MKDALNQVLQAINEDSLGVFNLRLSDKGDNILSGTDANYTTPPGSTTSKDATDTSNTNTDANIESDSVDDTFLFSEFSPNTIVNSLDLQMAMENNALANKIAIQGMSAGSMVYPLSSQLRKDLAVKDINISEDDNNLFFRHLPTQSQDADSKFMTNTLLDAKTKEDEKFLKFKKNKLKK